MADIQPLLKPEQVAEILGVPIRTLEDWRVDKRGPKFVRVQSKPRYKISDIERYINSNTVTTEPAVA